MTKYIFMIFITLILASASTYAQDGDKNQEDEKAIRKLVQNLSESWKAGDAKKYAENFVDDVDFTVWNGMYMHGNEANEKGHQQIFDTFYKGTEIRTKVRKIRFLSDTIAVTHLESEMFRGGAKVEDVPRVVPLMILQKNEGKWKVVVFQNTPIIKQGELVVGRTNETGEK
ncbi:MAG: SgcJ/EcaC family oxidoreductase [Pyrinomonadaceae bacterium]